MSSKCKCHKCNKEYPAGLFFTCPFCFVAEYEGGDPLAAALAEVACEEAIHATNCPSCPFDTDCNLNHAGDCAKVA